MDTLHLRRKAAHRPFMTTATDAIPRQTEMPGPCVRPILQQETQKYMETTHRSRGLQMGLSWSQLQMLSHNRKRCRDLVDDLCCNRKPKNNWRRSTKAEGSRWAFHGHSYRCYPTTDGNGGNLLTTSVHTGHSEIIGDDPLKQRAADGPFMVTATDAIPQQTEMPGTC